MFISSNTFKTSTFKTKKLKGHVVKHFPLSLFIVNNVNDYSAGASVGASGAPSSSSSTTTLAAFNVTTAWS